MPVEVMREEFLQKLDEISPGLSPKDIVEQSACAVFKDGFIYTFNEEVSCRIPSGLPKDFTGAVHCEPLRKILRKIPDEKITLEPTKANLHVVGKGKDIWVRMEKEILLPVDLVDLPEKWKSIHKDFADAITVTSECASDLPNMISACIHITPSCVESGDGFQVSRYTLDTGVKSNLLVEAKDVKNVGLFDVSHFGLTEKWIHFKGTTGLILSCVLRMGDYEELEKHLEGTGTKATLPEALADTAERAEIFSSEVKDKNKLIVELQHNRMRVTGIGNSGGYRERKTIKYDGKPMKFLVTPKLLAKIVQHSSQCEIDRKKRQIRVRGKNFVWMACLQDIDAQDNGAEK